MPYIPKNKRELLKDYNWVPLPQNPGELNYAICRLVDRVLGPSPQYEDLNAVVGVLECVKQEVYRRILSPYEDMKIGQHGDVFEERFG